MMSSMIFFHQYPHSIPPSSTFYLKYTSPTSQADQSYLGVTPPLHTYQFSWTITSNLLCRPSPPSSKTPTISCKWFLMTSSLSQRVPPWSHLTLKPYTPISHMMRVYEGIWACLKAINDHYHNDPPLPLHYLKQMMEFILKCNYFDFNGEHFLQTMGTAMGTAFAPNYANIYMGYFEQKALSKAPNNLQPLIWKRFIDDIFFIWTHGGTALQEFYDYLNTIHPTIKFEISHSNQEINFLDTTIFFKHDTKLESTLFVKSTDTCSLLHATSFHPDSCKSSVIYSQALRYCRIITDHTKLKEQLDILKENLLRRGYQLSQIHKNFRKATQYSQSELLNRSNFPETKKQILPFITHYNNTNIQISRILRTHWHIIQDDPTVNWLWHQPPILAMKRNKNLKDFLVHTNLVISTPPKP